MLLDFGPIYSIQRKSLAMIGPFADVYPRTCDDTDSIPNWASRRTEEEVEIENPRISWPVA